MVKIGLVGHSGRMGKQIKELIDKSEEFVLEGIWDRKGARLIKEPSKTWSKDFIDVVIDFSLPENFEKVVDWAQKNQVALVSGITGMDVFTVKGHLKEMGFENLKAPFFWSSNMSLGIATLRHMLKSLALFQGAEIKITETHHIHKKDKPSGTAITLKQDLEGLFNKEAKVHAIREGEVFGIHEIVIRNENEEIFLKHTALDRKVFAQGSLEVAKWIVGQPMGFFEMGDFLKDVTKP